MHAHGTAVLTESAEAITAVLPGASARDQWVARCTDDAAKALATNHADLLPVMAADVSLPETMRCPDCLGTGYTNFDGIIEPCQCGNFEAPAYDWLRYPARYPSPDGVVSTSELSTNTPDGKAEVWVPCQHCDILPIKLGPYDGDDPTRVPWVPDCPACNDTGWTFHNYIPIKEAFPW